MCDSLSVQTVVMRSQPYRLKKDPAFRDDAERMSKMMGVVGVKLIKLCRNS
jgi:hypothetical protein